MALQPEEKRMHFFWNATSLHLQCIKNGTDACFCFFRPARRSHSIDKMKWQCKCVRVFFFVQNKTIFAAIQLDVYSNRIMEISMCDLNAYHYTSKQLCVFFMPLFLSFSLLFSAHFVCTFHFPNQQEQRPKKVDGKIKQRIRKCVR